MKNNINPVVEVRIYGSRTSFGVNYPNIDGTTIQGTWDEILEKLKEYRDVNPAVGVALIPLKKEL